MSPIGARGVSGLLVAPVFMVFRTNVELPRDVEVHLAAVLVDGIAVATHNVGIIVTDGRIVRWTSRFDKVHFNVVDSP